MEKQAIMSRKRNHIKQDKADLLVSKLIESGMLKAGSVYDIAVLHDDNCTYKSGKCNCHPILQIIDTSLEASWDLSKLPAGLRAKEGDVSVIRFGSDVVN